MASCIPFLQKYYHALLCYNQFMRQEKIKPDSELGEASLRFSRWWTLYGLVAIMSGVGRDEELIDDKGVLNL